MLFTAPAAKQTNEKQRNRKRNSTANRPKQKTGHGMKVGHGCFCFGCSQARKMLLSNK